MKIEILTDAGLKITNTLLKFQELKINTVIKLMETKEVDSDKYKEYEDILGESLLDVLNKQEEFKSMVNNIKGC